jgi:nucleoside-diphosphate-sugar epimerase
MRVLVTGSAGYIGSVLVPELLAAGHDVVGLDAMYFDAGDPFVSGGGSVETMRMDVRDVTPELLTGFDGIVHLAALSNDPLGDLDPELTYDINLRASVALAESARRAGVERFVFSSSCSIYGASSSSEAVDESATLAPLTPYAESKVLAEEALAKLADESFAPVSLRNATAYGVSPRLRVDLVLNNLVAWAHTTGEVRLLSDGESWRPLVHVQDISRAAVAVLEAPLDSIRGESFNIGTSKQNYRIRDLAETVATVVPDCEVGFGEDSSPDPRSYRVDFGKFEQAFPDSGLSWEAAAGAAELEAAYRSTGFTFEAFDGPAYTRLKRLNELREAGRLDESLRWQPATAR